MMRASALQLLALAAAPALIAGYWLYHGLAWLWGL